MANAAITLPSIQEDEIREKYPLHSCAWENNTKKLEELLESKMYNCEATDPHGRTPLLLAVALGFKESVDILLKYSCDASATDKKGWSATQEAVSTGEPEIISQIIQHREFQRFTQKTGGIAQILEALEEADDFYVEMKWEFSSWVPLLSRVCPNDSYKIYKSGPNVRVDTTLKGFEQMTWQRGNQSYIFRGGAKVTEVYEVDHDKKSYWKESINVRDDSMSLESLRPPPSVISARLNMPNTTVVLDHENISFTRQKSGFLGWGGEKTDTVNGYEAKVFSVSGVELVTRTRMEHLSEEDRKRIEEEKKRAQSQASSMMNFLNQPEKEEPVATEGICDVESSNPYNLTLEEYFNPRLYPGKDVGKLRKMTSKTQKFSATVALSDTFPLSLQEQVLPIINLMANSSSHFAKLRDFITLQLPAGFPIKIEIPLFRVLNARITFNNINGIENCPPGVMVLDEENQENNDSSSEEPAAEATANKTSKCMIDKSIFEIYKKYKDLGMDVAMYRDAGDTYREEEDELLQLAIQQSLNESNTFDDTATNERVSTQTWSVTQSQQDKDLQRAIRESLNMQTEGAEGHNISLEEGQFENLSEDQQLHLVMQLSEKEDKEKELRRKQEEEELEKILALSLTEK